MKNKKKTKERGHGKINSTLLCSLSVCVVIPFQRTIFNFHVHKMEKDERKKSNNSEMSIPPANVIIIGDAKDRKKERKGKSDTSI